MAGSEPPNRLRGRLPDGLQKRLDEYEKKLEEVDFYILVWGPGKGREKDYDKRVAIREHLAERFSPHSVFMSEDEAFQKFVDKHGLQTAEALQVRAVHTIVVLDTTDSTHTEITRYQHDINGKCIIFAPQEKVAADTYASRAYDLLNVQGFSPEQYKTCNEIRRRALNFCKALQLTKAERENRL